MPNTPLGVPYPSAASAPTVQADLQALATAIEERIIHYCTSTTRPTLLAADEGVVIFQTNNNLYAQWDGSAWRPFAVFHCTSATRPSVGLLAGQIIYQTDTLSYHSWNGTVWDDLGGVGIASTFLLMGA